MFINGAGIGPKGQEVFDLACMSITGAVENRPGGVRVNTGTHWVFVGGRKIELKNRGYTLLLFLTLNVDMVFDRETLYEKVWDLEAMGDNATAAAPINRLREKIEKDPPKPRYIETVWAPGIGSGGK